MNLHLVKRYTTLLVLNGLSLLTLGIPVHAITTMASSLNSPWTLAIDSSYVYWVENDSSNGAVRKVPLSGGSITTLATGLNEPSAIAVDGISVYWIERNNGSNGSIKKVPIGGGSVTTLAAGLNNAQNNMALDASYIYFGDGKTGGGGTIRKISKAGGSVITLVDTDIINIETAVAVDSSYVYFTDDQNNIKRVPVGGGSVSILGSGHPWGMALDSSNIYWAEDSLVKKMPKSGGSATTLASGESWAAGVAVDSSFVYWITFNNPGRVKKVPISGGNVVTIATEGNTIGIAVDSQYVYWTVSEYINNGKVQKESTQNLSPDTPSTPTGDSSLIANQNGAYSTSATDLNSGDQVKYGWDWNGDGTVDEWSGFGASGWTDSRSHSWASFGTYNIKVKAQDSGGLESGWSSPKSVTITVLPNVPSTPSGETSRIAAQNGTYSTSATDPDNHSV